MCTSSDLQIGSSLRGARRIRDDKTYREFASLYHSLKDEGLTPGTIAEVVKTMLGISHTTYYDYLRESRSKGFIKDSQAVTNAERYAREKLLRDQAYAETPAVSCETEDGVVDVVELATPDNDNVIEFPAKGIQADIILSELDIIQTPNIEYVETLDEVVDTDEDVKEEIQYFGVDWAKEEPKKRGFFRRILDLFRGK